MVGGVESEWDSDGASGRCVVTVRHWSAASWNQSAVKVFESSFCFCHFISLCWCLQCLIGTPVFILPSAA